MINPDIEDVYLIPENELKNLDAKNIKALTNENKTLKTTILITIIIVFIITISNYLNSKKLKENEKKYIR